MVDEFWSWSSTCLVRGPFTYELALLRYYGARGRLLWCSTPCRWEAVQFWCLSREDSSLSFPHCTRYMDCCSVRHDDPGICTSRYVCRQSVFSGISYIFTATHLASRPNCQVFPCRQWRAWFGATQCSQALVIPIEASFGLASRVLLVSPQFLRGWCLVSRLQEPQHGAHTWLGSQAAAWSVESACLSPIWRFLLSRASPFVAPASQPKTFGCLLSSAGSFSCLQLAGWGPSLFARLDLASRCRFSSREGQAFSPWDSGSSPSAATVKLLRRFFAG